VCCRLRQRGLTCSVVDPLIATKAGRACYITIHVDEENLIFLDQGKPDHLVMTHTGNWEINQEDKPPFNLALSDPTVFDQIVYFAKTMDEWTKKR